MTPGKPIYSVLLFALTALLPSIVEAQTNYEPRDLTRGVSVPGGGGVAGDYDATAVTLNPAGLATLGGSSIAFSFTQLDEGKTLIGGGGWGLFLGLPLVLKLPNDEHFTLSYGFGYQGLDSPDSWIGSIPGGENQDGSYLLNTVALGIPKLSVGYTIGTFFWSDRPQDESILTHHFGIALRPLRFLAAGLTIRDVFEPVGGGPEEKFSRSYDADIMVRPLGDWRVELGGGALIGEDKLVDIRGRALVRPIDGVTVFAQYESIERRFGAPGASPSRDNRILAGITINSLDGLLGNRKPVLAASYATLTSTKSPKFYGGSTVMVRWAQEKYPGLIERKRVEKIAFNTALSDRAFVRKLLYLRSAAKADDIAGVVLVIGPNSLGWGRSEELRDAVAQVRRAGKQVLAYLHDGGMRQYYVASACDRVLLHPTTSLQLTGVATQIVYFRDLLDRIGVSAEVLKIAEYKSAPESFTRTSASDKAREQLRVYLKDVVNSFATRVAQSRESNAEQVLAHFGRTTIAPPTAKDLNLVDDIVHPDELEDAAKVLFGRKIRISKPSKPSKRPTQWTSPRIAVIYVEGEIVPGPSSPGLFGPTITGDDIAKAIKKARESSAVEAIVLRINSPGGVVLPSERIAREVELTRGKKPIIVSMGDVAASGGYMVAAHGDKVYAEPSTLTGSIGIFAVKLNVTELFAKVGLSSETFKIGDHADADSASRPWSEDERTAKHQELTYLYDRFIKLVSTGRKLSEKQTRAAARGRIWSGSRAKSNGLVDEMGGFLDALEEARRRTGLPRRTEIQVVHWPVASGGVLTQFLGLNTKTKKLLDGLPGPLRSALRSFPAVLWWGNENLARLPWTSTDQEIQLP